MPFIIQTQNLTKKFGNFIAVNNLNLKIEEGITYGLLGPNGSGKTTTIKMLIGLIKITSGNAIVLNEKVPNEKIKSKIGYMPQEIALYNDLTVHENIMLFGELFGLSREEIERKEIELLEFIALQKWKNELVQNLSGGMKHRTSLICSFVHSPILLFLDEPTVGVDPELRVSFWDYFKKLNEKGITIILTTHYMDEANRCDKVGLMKEGKLIAEGIPKELIESTNTKNLEDAFLVLSKQNIIRNMKS